MNKVLNKKNDKLFLLILPGILVILAAAVLIPQLDTIIFKDEAAYIPVSMPIETEAPSYSPSPFLAVSSTPVPEHGLSINNNKLCFYDSSSDRFGTLGIDVSFYNGSINWNDLKNYGIDFALIRLGGRGWGTGALYKDDFFFEYLNGVKRAGLKVGVYFYSAATNTTEAINEARLVIKALCGIGLDLPVFFDTEFSGDYPSGRSDKLSIAQRMEITNAFCREIEESGYEAGIYSGESFLTINLSNRDLQKYSIWLASYTENCSLPMYKGKYDIWQFTDRAKVPGVSGNVDLNVMFN